MSCVGKRGRANNAGEDGDAEPVGSGVYWTPVLLVSTMLFVDGLGYFMSMAPQTQLFEDIACRQYYKVDKSSSQLDRPPGSMCKEPAVQDVVAQLFGWQTFFDGIPGLLLAMWFGVIADVHGRRLVFFLSLLGQILSSGWVLFICWLELPLRLVWLSSFFLVIGGGGTVTGAIAMMILTDASPEKHRSSIFFYSQAALIVAELLGPVIGSTLMGISLWHPLLLALACTIVTAVLAAMTPETLHHGRHRQGYVESQHQVLTGSASLQGTLRELTQHVYKTLSFIMRRRSVLFLVLTFLVVDFSRQSLSVLLQYLSTRYAIPISQANYVLSLRAMAQLITFIAVLPLLDTFVSSNLHLSARVKDFFLSRLSIGFIMASFAILVVAPNIPFVIIGLAFYTFGNGFSSFARSLLSSLVEQDMVGTLFTTLSMMDTAGSLLAGPIVAQAFSWSMRIEGMGKGIPYIMSFIGCALASLALHRVRSDVFSLEEHECDDEERSSFLSRGNIAADSREEIRTP